MHEYDDDNRYEYDHKDKKKDVKNVKKIICVDKNFNINGILDVDLGRFSNYNNDRWSISNW